MLSKFKALFKPRLLGEADPNPNSSQFEANNWVASQVVLRDIVPQVGIHPFPLNELLLMTGTVARLKPNLVFEWGTHIGKSARVFYEATRAYKLPTIIHTCDLPDDVEHVEHPHEERGYLVRGLARVELHQGDGLDVSKQILSEQKGDMKSGKGSLFFVDGDHSYDSVKRELSAIMEFAPDAAVLLHDTFFQSKDSGYNVGPYDAIGECVAASRRNYNRIDTNTGLPGMTLLVPR
jgi:cephalosporin hydroxylase